MHQKKFTMLLINNWSKTLASCLAKQSLAFLIFVSFRTIRKDIEAVNLRKLSRKPSRDLVKLNTSYESLYETVSKIRMDALAKLPTKKDSEKKGDEVASNDVEMETEDNKAQEVVLD